MGILKIFAKVKEDEAYDYADFYQTQLQAITSDFVLGVISKEEYEELSRTLNDSAYRIAESKVEKLENDISGSKKRAS